MKINIPIEKLKTHEGAPAARISPELQLRRSVMACMLWEDTFYESGASIADRIAELVNQVDVDAVVGIAIEAREKMKLRHVPLWMVCAMAKSKNHKYLVADTLERVIQRPDELSEFIAVYWKDGKCPLSAQVKKGLARAFCKFDAYQLAKYNRDGAVKLRDVLFLCHAKPKDEEQSAIWKRLVDGTLESPDTWEVSLSSGADKKETWERLLKENKLGALALLRNLRNMKDAVVDEKIIFGALESMSVERVLPFRFISAAKYAPQWEPQIEKAMLKCLEGKEKLPGKTVLLVDVSGSMDYKLSDKSDLRRYDAAAGLAILAREICENVSIFVFATESRQLPARHGFALRDAIVQIIGGGTNTGSAVDKINNIEKYDRMIILTDEQSHQVIPAPTALGYVVNVSSNQNGIGYGAWTHIDGWSEAILDYIKQSEE